MGIFDVFKKKESTENKTVSVELTKKVNLAKEEVKKVCLTKEPLQNLIANVGVVLDYTGSMGDLYDNGTVQTTVEKLLPLAMTFDDNGTMEAWRFSDSFKRLKGITLDNLHNYLKETNSCDPRGCTYYAPVIKDVINTYKKNKVPAYVIFITDGDNFDKDETTKLIKEASKYPIFWQFVGIGNEEFTYLQKLDDMDGRYVDNADFFKVHKASDITYDKLLTEFPKWLEIPEVKTMLGVNKGEIVYE